MRDECDENPTVNSMPRGLKYSAGHNHDDDLGSVVLVGVTAGPPMSELSHQSGPFQEGYLRIFSVTFLQISCTCFPARFLVTIIFQQLSCQLITGRNTKLPTTLRGVATAGRENVLWSGKSDTNGLVLQQQRNDHAIRQNHFCA